MRRRFIIELPGGETYEAFVPYVFPSKKYRMTDIASHPTNLVYDTGAISIDQIRAIVDEPSDTETT